MKSSNNQTKHRYQIIGSANLPRPFTNSFTQPLPSNLKCEPGSTFNKTSFTKKSDKVFYNPNFLRKTQEDQQVNRRIHINPNFVSKTTLPSKSIQNIDGLEVDSMSKGQNIHFNPRFLENPKVVSSLKSKPSNCVSKGALPSVLNKKMESKLVKPTNLPEFRVSKYSLDKRSTQIVPRKSCNLSSNIQQSKSTVPMCRPVLNNKYKKVNNVIPSNLVSSSKVLKSKYAIRRVTIKTEPGRPMVVNTPGSFRKIGKRKLVRKSLLQNYITARRFSTPYSMHHMRQIAQKKAARDPQTPLKSKYKLVRRNLCYSKDNRVKSRQSSEFLKISKRKIVRKSIISSIIEAKRSSAVSRRCKVVSRYKIRKVTKVPTVNSSFISKTIIHSRIPFSTKWAKNAVDLSRMSKSVMYRMRPGVRLRAKFVVKKLALLRKNNAKCSFYNRFGYCKGKDNGLCKKVHDSKSISVCKKYLLGECTNSSCRLNHTRSKEKMPTCHQYLAGVCVRENCPFLHVKVHAASSICREFLSGFCPSGNACTKRHVFICPDWEAGSCPRKVCPYPHPKPSKVFKKRPSASKSKALLTSSKTLGKLSSQVGSVECESNDRYFDSNGSPEVPAIMNDSLDTEEPLESEKKSVYADESLLAFIPFSDD